MNFSDHLRTLMERRGMTQASLAEKVSVSQGAVCGWLRGARPSSDKLEKLAEALKVDIATLLNSAPSMSSHSLQEEPTPYTTCPSPPSSRLSPRDVIHQIRLDLDRIENGPVKDSRLAFLFLRDIHLPALASALKIDD